MVSRNKAF